MTASIPRAALHRGGGSRLRARLRAARRWRRDTAAGRTATWSITLGAAQAGLMIGTAGEHVARVPALIVLTGAFALAAALVVGTTWLLRLALPFPRAVGPIVTAAFYGGLVAVATGAHGLFAATLLAPALAWSPWLPAGTFHFGDGAGAGCGAGCGRSPTR